MEKMNKEKIKFAKRFYENCLVQGTHDAYRGIIVSVWQDQNPIPFWSRISLTVRAICFLRYIPLKALRLAFSKKEPF